MMVTDPVGVCSDFSATFCMQMVAPRPHSELSPPFPQSPPNPTLYGPYLPSHSHSLSHHPLLQLCEAGYALDMGECSQCLAGAIGRVTTFGLIVISAISGVALVVLALHFLKVGPFACFRCVAQSNLCTRDHAL